MPSITETNKTLDLKKEMVDLKHKSMKKTILKSLAALVLLVAGVAAIVFMNSSFLPYGIGLILISSVAIYQYLNHHQNASTIFSRAASASLNPSK